MPEFKEINFFLSEIILPVMRDLSPERLMYQTMKFKDNRLIIHNRQIDFNQFKKIIVAGAGKASASMANGLSEILKDRLDTGLIVGLEKQTINNPKIKFIASSHPQITTKSLHAANSLLSFLKTNTTPESLVFFLISGGASSLIARPAKFLSLSQKALLIKKLSNLGADISELNAFRKRLSAIKGGRLLNYFSPAILINLILCDVSDGRISNVGSGPTCVDYPPDSMILNIIKKYRLAEIFDKNILRKIIKRHHSSRIIQYPVLNLKIADNNLLIRKIAQKFQQRGFKKIYVENSPESGSTEEFSTIFADKINNYCHSLSETEKPFIFISGGEHTVKLLKKGKNGGRNGDFLLRVLAKIKTPSSPFMLISASSDNRDGNSNYQGAYIDSLTMQKAKAKKLNVDFFLTEYKSYEFFEKLKQTVSFHSENNLLDFRILIIY